MDAPARKGWRVFLLLLVLGTCWLAFTPSPPPKVDTGWDKLNHGIAFAAMAFTAGFAFAQTPHRWFKVVCALLSFGVVIELVQSQIPGRDAEALDVLADAFGIAGGVLIVWAHERLQQQRHRRPH